MYKNILIPVVFDEQHDTQASFLAAKALADEEAKFSVLHVMEAIPSYVAAEIPAETLAASRSESENRLRTLAKGLPGAEAVLMSGHPGRLITDYAQKNGVDCIVLASHVPGASNILLGSTADRVVRHAACSVHVIR